MHSFSIVVNNRYLELGLSELLNQALQKSACEGVFNVKPLSCSENDFLFIDVSNIDRINVLDSVVNSIVFNEVFIIISRYDNDFNGFFIDLEIKGKATLLCYDDPLPILEKKIISVIKRKKKYRNGLNSSLGDLTLSNYTPKINLTKQEAIIITHFKYGLSGLAVAKILNKSEKTVSAQKRSAMKKIGVRTNNELLRKILIN